jgi:tetratricopeptide (TPR) repeat protein
MREAANLEDSVDKNPVTPGSVLPAWELLGEMLLLSGKPEEAIAAYETSLTIAPYRFNSLYGAGSAAERIGNTEMAKSYYEALVQISARADDARPEIQWAESFIASTKTQGKK